jgi:hypothetical protein
VGLGAVAAGLPLMRDESWGMCSPRAGLAPLNLAFLSAYPLGLQLLKLARHAIRSSRLRVLLFPPPRELRLIRAG